MTTRRRRRWRAGAARALLAGGLLLGLLGAGAAPAAAEPNDTMATADGPILNGTVAEAINTENDADWFFFYAQGSTQLDIALTGLGPEGSCSRWTVELLDSHGEYLSDARADFNQVDHILYTVPDPDTYYLKAWGGYCETVGYYRLDIAASPLLLSSPPSPAGGDVPGVGSATRRAACQRAQRQVRTLKRKLRRANRRRARGARARRRLRRRRVGLRANLRRARAQARRRCRGR